MGQVTVTVNGRRYDIGCDDGQEEHVTRLAAGLDRRIGNLVRTMGQIGEARLLLLGALLMADELHEAKRQPAAASGPEAAFDAGPVLVELAERIEAVARHLDKA
jgi:cell division protein ZapA